MLELRLRYTGNGTFQTAGRRDWELADAELEPGAVLRARIWRPRSVRQNDFFHALIEAAFESQRGGPRLPTWRHLKAYLLIQAGHCEEVRLRLGQRQTEGEAVTMAGTLAQALRRVGLGRQHARAGWLEFTQAKNRKAPEGRATCARFRKLETQMQDIPLDAYETETKPGHATPLRAVRQHCLMCCNGSANEVRLCPARACPLWPFRHGHRPSPEDRAAVADQQLYPLERNLTGATFQGSALRAIRLRCIDCSGNSDVEVRACTFGPGHPTHCDLHPFRLGRNPNISHGLEWKQAAAERLALARVAALPAKPSQSPILFHDQGAEGVGAGKGHPSPKSHAQ